MELIAQYTRLLLIQSQPSLSSSSFLTGAIFFVACGGGAATRDGAFQSSPDPASLREERPPDVPPLSVILGRSCDGGRRLLDR